MSDNNFYAPPSAPVNDFEVETPMGIGVISGKTLKATSPLVLPSNVCVCCGARGAPGKTYQKKLYYVTQWIVLAVLLNFLIMLVLYLILRKKLEASYSLCPACVEKRKRRVLIAVAVGVGSILTIVGGSIADIFPLILIGGLGALGALVAGYIFGKPPLRPSGHTNGTFTVKGASAEFLDQLKKRPAAEPTGW